MTATLIILGAVVAAGLYLVSLYNGLVKKRQMAKEGWSGIDVQLKRRSNLIPNLLAAVKGYMKHEKTILTEITELRAGADKARGQNPEARAKAESALGAGLIRLNAVMENYPDLKANENVLSLQKSLAEIESEIQMSRRYYNGAVRNLNVMVEALPSNIIAGQFGFEKMEFFEIEDATSRQVPKVEF